MIIRSRDRRATRANGLSTGIVRTQPVFRDWELHIENWSNSYLLAAGLEVIWHGKPIEGGSDRQDLSVAKAQRVQGFVGIDTNSDEQFNFTSLEPNLIDTDGDPPRFAWRRHSPARLRRQQPERNLRRRRHDQPGAVRREHPRRGLSRRSSRRRRRSPTAQFLTGADGNYYFDLDPNFEYEIESPPITVGSGIRRRLGYAVAVHASTSRKVGGSRRIGSMRQIATIRCS